MPLGKLSKSQIAKGFEVLEHIELLLNTKDDEHGGSLAYLSSRFYTLIPHDFGRQRPPIISDLETVRKKMDMLMVGADPAAACWLLTKHLSISQVLADIEIAQCMQEEEKKKAANNVMSTIFIAEKLDIVLRVFLIQDADTIVHPLDQQYAILDCKLKPLSKESEDFSVSKQFLVLFTSYETFIYFCAQMIEKYIAYTKRNYVTLLDVWEVDRGSEV